MAKPTPIFRIPRVRLLLPAWIVDVGGALVPGTDGKPTFNPDELVDLGSLEDVTFATEGEPTQDEVFDDETCTKTMSDPEYLTLTGILTAQMASGDARNIAEGLMAANITDPAEAKTATITGPVLDNGLIDLGYAPAGSMVDGKFVPDALTTAEDSDVGPTSLVLGTNYEWYDGRNGIIKALDVESLVFPLNFTGNSRQISRVEATNAAGVVRPVVLIGVDQRNACTGESLRVHRAYVPPGSESLMSQALEDDDSRPVPLTMNAMMDTSKASGLAVSGLASFRRG